MERCTVLICVPLALFCSGCFRTPAEKKARFMARGKQFYEKSDYARAILEFENAARIPPADAEPFYRLGLAHLAAGDSTFAAACFRKSTSIDPKHLAAQLKL